MVFVACSGFPVPVSRYWNDFLAVELSDTELGIPGAGTVRRWLRESPEGFQFTVRAPKVIAESGFEKNTENKQLMRELTELITTLNASVGAYHNYSQGLNARINALEAAQLTFKGGDGASPVEVHQIQIAPDLQFAYYPTGKILWVQRDAPLASNAYS